MTIDEKMRNKIHWILSFPLEWQVINWIEILHSYTLSLIYPDNAVMSSSKCQARSVNVKWVKVHYWKVFLDSGFWILILIKGFVTLFSSLDSEDFICAKNWHCQTVKNQISKIFLNYQSRPFSGLKFTLIGMQPSCVFKIRTAPDGNVWMIYLNREIPCGKPYNWYNFKKYFKALFELFLEILSIPI